MTTTTIRTHWTGTGNKFVPGLIKLTKYASDMSSRALQEAKKKKESESGFRLITVKGVCGVSQWLLIKQQLGNFNIVEW
jgi:hypothetical protein